MAPKAPKAPADTYDDFGIVPSGSATLYDSGTFDRIVGYLTTKADDVTKAMQKGEAISTPVVIPADVDRSTQANTAWDYLEPLRAHVTMPEGKVLGTKWQKGDSGKRLLLVARKAKTQ